MGEVAFVVGWEKPDGVWEMLPPVGRMIEVFNRVTFVFRDGLKSTRAFAAFVYAPPEKFRMFVRTVFIATVELAPGCSVGWFGVSVRTVDPFT